MLRFGTGEKEPKLFLISVREDGEVELCHSCEVLDVFKIDLCVPFQLAQREYRRDRG